MTNKRFWAVLALAAVLVALAFFLPPQVSRWYDQQLMDEPKVTQVEDREGLVDSPLKAEPDEKKETDIRLEL